MPIKTVDDIVRLIKSRDKLSLTEANIIVNDCLDEIKAIVCHDGTLDEVEDVVRDYLGLEPDYVDILLADLM